MRRFNLYLSIFLVCGLLIPTLTGAQTPSPRVLGNCGERIFALTTNNNLISFSSDSPGTILSTTAITGLQAGESLVGIDFRPAVGLIYGLSNQSRVYILDSTTGQARQTAILSESAIGANFGVDFNPVPDRLRVVNESNQNLRINVENGVAAVDTPLAFAAGDPNASADPNVVASAYINNFAGTTATTLYGIDSNLDILVLQNPPNNGTLNTVGSLGVDTTDVAGFDIAAGSTRAFASLNVGGSSGLYTINLRTGAATLVGTIGGGQAIRDITVDPRRSLTAFAVTTGNRLLTLDLDFPGVITNSVRIRGLLPGETIVGIDFRPFNRRLYGLGSSGRIYLISTTNGGRAVARLVSPFTPGLNGTAFGFDFNPVPDRIRLTSNADQDLRLNPDTGEVVAVDGTLAFVAGDPNSGADPNIVASAYTNNFAGTTATTLYGIDSNLDILVIQNPPNNGTLNTVGSLGVNTTDVVGFDIVACDNSGYAVLNLAGETTSKLFRIDLATGTATLLATIPGGATIQAFAVAFR
jgi:hypothetical protein